MVIATNLSPLFDLLHCSIPQTRTKCCLEFPWLAAIECFLACLGQLFPLPLCRLGVPCRDHPHFSTPKGKATAPWQTDRGLNPRSMACVRGVFPVCYIAVTCVTVFRTTRLQNHFTTLGLEPLTHLFHVPDTEDRAGPSASTRGGPGLQRGGHRDACARCILGMLSPLIESI